MGAKNGVLIVAAMGWEAATATAGRLKRLTLPGSPALRLREAVGRRGESLWVLQSGIGPAMAAAATTRALECLGPVVVVSTGCAGALCDGLAAGEIVIAEEVVDPKHHRWQSSPNWIERYETAARESGVRATRGKLLTSEALLSTAAEKRSAGRASRCEAVDMETAAIAEAAARAGAEFVAVRGILDVLETTLPHGLVDAWGHLRPLRVLRGLLGDRGFAGRLLELRRATRLCDTSLRKIHQRALA